MVKLLLPSALTRLIAVLGVALCVLPATVAAQPTLGQPSGVGIASAGRAERPYRGIFGSSAGSTNQRLIFEGSFGGGSSQLMSAIPGVPVQPGGLNGSNASGTAVGSGKIEYSSGGPRMGVNADNVFYTNYYPNIPSATIQFRDIASGAFYFVPAQSTRVTVSGTFKNLPELSYSELFGPEMSDLVPLVQDYPLRVDRFRRYGSAVEVSQNITSRIRVDGSFNYGNGKVTHGLSWTTFLVSGMVNYRITKGLGVDLGYAYGQQTTQDQALNKGVDRHPTIRFGVNFNRPLSFTRRTTLVFATGMAQIHDRTDGTTTNNLIVSAELKREFGRSWSASLIYNRDARFVESIAQPVLKDALSAVVDGSFTRRVQWRSGLGASQGQVGTARGNGFDTFFGMAQCSMAVTRYVAVAADYAYSKFSNPITVNGQRLGQNSGQSFRMQMQLWLPLIMKTRNPGGSGSN